MRRPTTSAPGVHAVIDVQRTSIMNCRMISLVACFTFGLFGFSGNGLAAEHPVAIGVNASYDFDVVRNANIGWVRDGLG